MGITRTARPCSEAEWRKSGDTPALGSGATDPCPCRGRRPLNLIVLDLFFSCDYRVAPLRGSIGRWIRVVLSTHLREV